MRLVSLILSTMVGRSVVPEDTRSGDLCQKRWTPGPWVAIMRAPGGDTDQKVGATVASMILALTRVCRAWARFLSPAVENLPECGRQSAFGRCYRTLRAPKRSGVRPPAARVPAASPRSLGLTPGTGSLKRVAHPAPG